MANASVFNHCLHPTCYEQRRNVLTMMNTWNLKQSMFSFVAKQRNNWNVATIALRYTVSGLLLWLGDSWFPQAENVWTPPCLKPPSSLCTSPKKYVDETILEHLQKQVRPFLTSAYGIQMSHSLERWNLLSLANKKIWKLDLMVVIQRNSNYWGFWVPTLAHSIS